jgi:polyhydroxybutyrate depolymerase
MVKSLMCLAFVVFAGLATIGCGRIAARREAAKIPHVTATVVATTSTSVPASSSTSTVLRSPATTPAPGTTTAQGDESSGPIVAPSTSSPTSTLTSTPSAAPYPAGATTVSFEFDGRKRTFTVYIPKSLSTDRPAPLVFQLHGGRGTGVETDGLTKLNALAEKERFIAVAPDGVEKNWNDGRTDVRDVAAFSKNIDDVGFLVTVLDEIGTHHRVDQSRVYSMGISNGAMMSARLACDRPDRFAAVGVVAGTGPAELADLCVGKDPVSIVAFHGTDDPLIDYNGDANVHPELGRRLSVDQFAQYWTARNGCAGDPVVDQPTATISRRTWRGGQADVVLYRVEGGGHTWPGGRQPLPKFIVGSTDGSMDATTVMWEFFKQHPRH